MRLRRVQKFKCYLSRSFVHHACVTALLRSMTFGSKVYFAKIQLFFCQCKKIPFFNKVLYHQKL